MWHQQVYPYMLQLGKHQVEHLHLFDQGLGFHKTSLQLVLQGPELKTCGVTLFYGSSSRQYILAKGSFVQRLAGLLRTMTYHLIYS